jgi:hypothetical protein
MDLLPISIRAIPSIPNPHERISPRRTPSVGHRTVVLAVFSDDSGDLADNSLCYTRVSLHGRRYVAEERAAEVDRAI